MSEQPINGDAIARDLGELAERIKRLSFTVRKLAGWAGMDIADLIEDGYLNEGDLDA